MITLGITGRSGCGKSTVTAVFAAHGLVVSVHTQVKTDVITALSDGGVEQKLVTLSGVRRAAVLEKLVTVEGEIRFPTPPAAVLDLSGNASVGDLKLLNGKAVAKGGLVVSCAWRAEGDPVLQSQSVNLNFNQVLDVDGCFFFPGYRIFYL